MSANYPIIEWEDDYPTEESLQSLRDFLPSLEQSHTLPDDHPAKSDRHILNVCELIRSLPEQMEPCRYARAWTEPVKDFAVMADPVEVHFATGGWSGAEDIISIIWESWEAQMYAKRWERGGKFVFEVFATPAQEQPK